MDDGILRFDYKKKMSLDRLIKFLDQSISQGKFIEMKLIYAVRDIPKVLKLSFNFYYRTTTQNQVFSLFKPHYVA
jgi:hypothetical protein